MRIVYMDEAGISKVSQEPHLVVAAAITHPDRQWHDLRRHYDDLAADFFDEDMGYGFVFHAKDIWHGARPYDRSKYSLTERMKLLLRLAQVPKLYGVPICLGMIKREAFGAANPDMSAKQKRIFSHALAAHLALQRVDAWMETNCPDEVAMIVAEDTAEVKEVIHLFHQSAQSDPQVTDHEDPLHFQTRCIVDSVNFAPKDRSPILQLADTCAFLTRRRLADCGHSHHMFREIWPMVVRSKSKSREVVLKIPIHRLELVESA